MLESSKTFRNLPCSHRRFRHDGHCAWIHGYSRSFTLWFRCHTLSDNGFVMDFGGLGEVQKWLQDRYDHTMLLDAADPLLHEFKRLEKLGACKLVVYRDVGMEGTAQHVLDEVGPMVARMTNGRVWLHSVEVRENDKNSARITLDAEG